MRSAVVIYKGPTQGHTVCGTQAVAQTVWPCVVWFDRFYNILTILKKVWILLCNSQVVQKSEARVDILVILVINQLNAQNLAL